MQQLARLDAKRPHMKSHHKVRAGLATIITAVVLLFLGSARTLLAANNQARVTVVVHEVNLLAEKAKARPAVLNETVHDDTSVRTGDQSRSELTFPDLTITRLVANSIFSFDKAGRSVQLNGGAMLLRVPKDSGGAQMRTDACSVAITGTTVVLEARSGRNKLYVLEGHARMALRAKPNESAAVGPGQMLDVPRGATSLPAVQNFDVNQFMSSNPLITDFPPLPSRDLIYAGASSPSGGGPIAPGLGLAPIIPPFLTGPIVSGGGHRHGNDVPGRYGTRRGSKDGNSGSGNTGANSVNNSAPVVGRTVNSADGATVNSVNAAARRSPTPAARKRKKP